MMTGETDRFEALALTDEQKQEQLTTILDFLKLVHPSLESGDNSAFVELRGIARDYDAVPYPIRSKSYNTSGLCDKDIDVLKTWLSKRVGMPMCLYYSVYAYDRWMKTFTKTGKEAQDGKITETAALYCEELPLDFDHIGKEEMEQYDEMFASVGIEPLWISSGHGYQCHILLTDKISDQSVMQYLVHLVIAKGFAHVDPVCVDKARVMRLPGTFNCKCFEKSTKYPEERQNPPRTTIVKLRTKRMSLDDLENAINSLPTVDWDEQVKALDIYEKAEQKRLEEQAPAEEKEHLKPLYSPVLEAAISGEEFPLAVKRALTYTPQGYRVQTLAFLMYFLSRYLKFSAEAIRDDLKIWATEACVPALEDFNQEFSSNWPGTGKYDLKKLSKQHGFFDLKSYVQVKDHSELCIPNKLLGEIGEVGMQSIAVYLGLLMAEHDGLQGTIANVSACAGTCSRATRKGLKTLVSKGYVRFIAGNRRGGTPDVYSASKIQAPGNGYLAVNFLAAKQYVTLSSAELCLFLLLRQNCLYQTDAIINQTVLSQKLGCDRTYVCACMKSLAKRKFISVEHKYLDSVMYRCAVNIEV